MRPRRRRRLAHPLTRCCVLGAGYRPLQNEEHCDFLNHLAEVNRDVPMLVLSFTRPTVFERRTDWSSTEGVHQCIDLKSPDDLGLNHGPGRIRHLAPRPARPRLTAQDPSRPPR